jgi:hypothetical protein
MSAAATAAGYLYASGRLRGRGAREQEHHQPGEQEKAQPRKEVKVAVYAPEEKDREKEKVRRTPKIEYRRKRWSAA